MSKLLITSGCSFSECITPEVHSWARHLEEILVMPHISKAMGSQGNGLISRGIIYQVNESLKTHKPEDLIVGIMWSGVTRHEYYHRDSNIEQSRNSKHYEGWMENPTSFVNGSDKNWVIMNYGWRKLEANKMYYDLMHDDDGAVIYTIEHILRVQWFLKQHNINYFMTFFVDNVIPPDTITKPDIKYLYDMIDFTKFLPVSSEASWLKHPPGFVKHPTNNEHREFANKVVYPYILDNNYI